jgi:ABC-type cobalamin transport system permease subunit
MEEGVIALLIPIVALIGATVAVIYLRKFQHAERMAMIEKGVGHDLLFGSKPLHTVSGTLRASLLLIGVGLGILCGYFLDEAFYMDVAGYFAMLFIFGGVGLGLAYLIEEKKYNSYTKTN